MAFVYAFQPINNCLLLVHHVSFIIGYMLCIKLCNAFLLDLALLTCFYVKWN